MNVPAEKIVEESVDQQKNKRMKLLYEVPNFPNIDASIINDVGTDCIGDHGSKSVHIDVDLNHPTVAHEEEIESGNNNFLFNERWNMAIVVGTINL